MVPLNINQSAGSLTYALSSLIGFPPAKFL